MAGQLEQRLEELETERSRMRDATTRFGEALMATHDPAQLVRIVVESAVESTGAVGRHRPRAARRARPRRRPERRERADRVPAPPRLLGLRLSWCSPSSSFEAEQVETAASLANQIVVALENARLHRLVEQQALIDSLTGLANRRSLEDTLRSELARAARFGDELCVVFADLDYFKRVNDLYGHAAGDEVLKAFATALHETVRESDFAGRWGGEEFALVLTGTGASGRRASRRASAAGDRGPDGTHVERRGGVGHRELRRRLLTRSAVSSASSSPQPTPRSTRPSARAGTGSSSRRSRRAREIV